MFKIFIVDDDLWYSEVLEYYLSMDPDNEITKIKTGKDCINNLAANPDLITLDYSLNDARGIDVLKKIKQYNPDIPVVIISGQEDVNTAVNLLKSGAQEYFAKDDNTKDLLLNAVIRLKEMKKLKREVEQLRGALEENFEIRNSIKGSCTAMQQIFSLIQRAAQTNINVSIFGETGTGKEVVAKAIHYNSARKKMPFVAINMAAIPKELMESELFGYEKGAFTGANQRKTGKFEEANKGTLFLDEIGELDPSLQSKLLRVIQEREVVRLGGNQKVELDIRIIVATHKNLEEEVSKGNFREDFYYRIIGLPVHLPPLRERGNDILILAKFFLDSFCSANHLKPIKISEEAKEKLMSYTYPGNIRELKSIIELAAVMGNGVTMAANDITFRNLSMNKQLLGVEKTLKEYNIEIISHFLKKYDNNVSKVADKLQIGKSTIYKMITDGELTI